MRPVALFVAFSIFFTQIVPLTGQFAFADSDPSREVILIPDAHADASAQLGIEKLLTEITQKEKIDFITLEGAWTPLTPEVLQFVRDPEANREILLHILKHGELSGAELFASKRGQSPKGPGPFFGVEDKALFSKYYFILQDILRGQSEAEAFTKRLRQRLIDQSHKDLNRDLKELIRAEELFEEGSLNISSYLDLLQKNSKLNISDQLEFPQVLRILALKKTQTSLDSGEFEKWKKSLNVQAASVRELLETLSDSGIEIPQKFKSYLSFKMLEEELVSKKLFEEIERLTQSLTEKLARTEKERAFLKEWKEVRLFGKLLKLRLSHVEWKNVRSSDFSRFAKDQRINSLLQASLDFYAGAGLRDQAMGRNLLKLFESRKARKAILITGGFHTEPLRQFLNSQGIVCREITPVPAGGRQQEGFSHLAGRLTMSHYHDAILNRSVILPRAATMPDEVGMKPAGDFIDPSNIQIKGQLAWDIIAQSKIRHGKILHQNQFLSAAAGASLGSRPEKKPDLPLSKTLADRLNKKTWLQQLIGFLPKRNMQVLRGFLETLRAVPAENDKFNKEIRSLPAKDEIAPHFFEHGVLIAMNPLTNLSGAGIIQILEYRSVPKSPVKIVKYYRFLDGREDEIRFDTVENVKRWESQYRLLATAAEMMQIIPEAKSLGEDSGWHSVGRFDGKILVHERTGRIKFAGDEPAVRLNLDLIAVRHGQTAGNIAHIFQGATDLPMNQLNETGKKQADEAALKLLLQLALLMRSGRKVVVLTSELGRAQETAAAFVWRVRDRMGLDLPVQHEKLLNEISFGDFSNKTEKDLSPEERQLAARYRVDLNARVKFPSGESFMDLLIRVKPFLEKLKKFEKENTIVVIFGHGTWLGAARVLLGDRSLADKTGQIDWADSNLTPHAMPVTLAKAADAAGSSLGEGPLTWDEIRNLIRKEFDFLTVREPIAMELKHPSALPASASDAKVSIEYNPSADYPHRWGHNPHLSFTRYPNLRWQWIVVRAVQEASPEEVVQAIVKDAKLPEKVRAAFRELGEAKGMKFEASSLGRKSQSGAVTRQIIMEVAGQILEMEQQGWKGYEIAFETLPLSHSIIPGRPDEYWIHLHLRKGPDADLGNGLLVKFEIKNGKIILSDLMAETDMSEAPGELPVGFVSLKNHVSKTAVQWLTETASRTVQARSEKIIQFVQRHKRGTLNFKHALARAVMPELRGVFDILKEEQFDPRGRAVEGGFIFERVGGTSVAASLGEYGAEVPERAGRLIRAPVFHTQFHPKNLDDRRLIKTLDGDADYQGVKYSDALQIAQQIKPGERVLAVYRDFDGWKRKILAGKFYILFMADGSLILFHRIPKERGDDVSPEFYRGNHWKEGPGTASINEDPTDLNQRARALSDVLFTRGNRARDALEASFAAAMQHWKDTGRVASDRLKMIRRLDRKRKGNQAGGASLGAENLLSRFQISPEDLAKLDRVFRDLEAEGKRIIAHYLEHPEHLGLKMKSEEGQVSPVTVVDKEIERYIREKAAAEFGADGVNVIGEEENASYDSRRPFTFVIDPIDGTNGFLMFLLYQLRQKPEVMPEFREQLEAQLKDRIKTYGLDLDKPEDRGFFGINVSVLLHGYPFRSFLYAPYYKAISPDGLLLEANDFDPGRVFYNHEPLMPYLIGQSTLKDEKGKTKRDGERPRVGFLLKEKGLANYFKHFLDAKIFPDGEIPLVCVCLQYVLFALEKNHLKDAARFRPEVIMLSKTRANLWDVITGIHFARATGKTVLGLDGKVIDQIDIDKLITQGKEGEFKMPTLLFGDEAFIRQSVLPALREDLKAIAREKPELLKKEFGVTAEELEGFASGASLGAQVDHKTYSDFTYLEFDLFARTGLPEKWEVNEEGLPRITAHSVFEEWRPYREKHAELSDRIRKVVESLPGKPRRIAYQVLDQFQKNRGVKGRPVTDVASLVSRTGISIGDIEEMFEAFLSKSEKTPESNSLKVKKERAPPRALSIPEINLRLKTWINEKLNHPASQSIHLRDLETLHQIFSAFPPEVKTQFVQELAQQIDPAGILSAADHRKDKRSKQARQRLPDALPIYTFAISNVLDLVVEFDSVSGELNVMNVRHDVGGKTINVTKTLLGFGRRVSFLGLLGAGPAGLAYFPFLGRLGLFGSLTIQTQSDVRIIPYFVGAKGEFSLLFRTPNAPFTSSEIGRFSSEALGRLAHAPEGAFVVTGGSVPPGMALQLFRWILELAKQRKLKVIFDNIHPGLSAEQMDTILKGSPYLIKPNLQEFAAVVKKDYETLVSEVEDGNFKTLIQEARTLLERYEIKLALISMEKHGALLVSKDKVVLATPPSVPVKSATAAGDSLIAGLVHKLSQGASLEDALRFAVATGTATVTKPGADVATLEEAAALFPKVTLKVIEGASLGESLFNGNDVLNGGRGTFRLNRKWRLSSEWQLPPFLKGESLAGSLFYPSFGLLPEGHQIQAVINRTNRIISRIALIFNSVFQTRSLTRAPLSERLKAAIKPFAIRSRLFFVNSIFIFAEPLSAYLKSIFNKSKYLFVNNKNERITPLGWKEGDKGGKGASLGQENGLGQILSGVLDYWRKNEAVMRYLWTHPIAGTAATESGIYDNVQAALEEALRSAADQGDVTRTFHILESLKLFFLAALNVQNPEKQPKEVQIVGGLVEIIQGILLYFKIMKGMTDALEGKFFEQEAPFALYEQSVKKNPESGAMSGAFRASEFSIKWSEDWSEAKIFDRSGKEILTAQTAPDERFTQECVYADGVLKLRAVRDDGKETFYIYELKKIAAASLGEDTRQAADTVVLYETLKENLRDISEIWRANEHLVMNIDGILYGEQFREGDGMFELYQKMFANLKPLGPNLEFLLAVERMAFLLEKELDDFQRKKVAGGEPESFVNASSQFAVLILEQIAKMFQTINKIAELEIPETPWDEIWTRDHRRSHIHHRFEKGGKTLWIRFGEALTMKPGQERILKVTADKDRFTPMVYVVRANKIGFITFNNHIHWLEENGETGAWTIREEEQSHGAEESFGMAQGSSLGQENVQPQSGRGIFRFNPSSRPEKAASSRRVEFRDYAVPMFASLARLQNLIRNRKVSAVAFENFWYELCELASRTSSLENFARAQNMKTALEFTAGIRRMTEAMFRAIASFDIPLLEEQDWLILESLLRNPSFPEEPQAGAITHQPQAPIGSSREETFQRRYSSRKHLIVFKEEMEVWAKTLKETDPASAFIKNGVLVIHWKLAGTFHIFKLDEIEFIEIHPNWHYITLVRFTEKGVEREYWYPGPTALELPRTHYQGSIGDFEIAVGQDERNAFFQQLTVRVPGADEIKIPVDKTHVSRVKLLADPSRPNRAPGPDVLIHYYDEKKDVLGFAVGELKVRFLDEWISNTYYVNQRIKFRLGNFLIYLTGGRAEVQGTQIMVAPIVLHVEKAGRFGWQREFDAKTIYQLKKFFLKLRPDGIPDPDRLWMEVDDEYDSKIEVEKPADAQGASLGTEINRITGHSLGSVLRVASEFGSSLISPRVAEASPAAARSLVEILERRHESPDRLRGDVLAFAADLKGGNNAFASKVISALAEARETRPVFNIVTSDQLSEEAIRITELSHRLNKKEFSFVFETGNVSRTVKEKLKHLERAELIEVDGELTAHQIEELIASKIRSKFNESVSDREIHSMISVNAPESVLAGLNHLAGLNLLAPVTENENFRRAGGREKLGALVLQRSLAHLLAFHRGDRTKLEIAGLGGILVSDSHQTGLSQIYEISWQSIGEYLTDLLTAIRAVQISA